MMDVSERELVRGSIRQLLNQTSAALVPAALIDSGWSELLADDACDAITILGHEVGRSLHGAPVVDLAIQHALGLGVDSATAVVLAPLQRGLSTTAGTVTNGRVRVNGMVLPGAIDRATRLLVATAQGVVVIDANTMETAAFEAPGTPLTMVTGTAAGPVVATPAAWLEATSVARKANAAVMIGLAHQMLDNTLAYIKQREQYGRAIGSFQAVKHVMADTHVAIVGASAAVVAAWSDGSATSADAALVLAVRAQGLAAKHCHQVHGGIAFTVEHGFHQYIRYGQLMSGIVGHPDDLVTSIGHRMAAGRVIPRTPQLK